MAADTLPRTGADATDTAPPLAVLRGVLRDRRRSLLLWSVALAAITAVYVSFYPAMGEGADLDVFVENLPEGLVSALGYDQIGTSGGYLGSTVFGILGPALLLVFAIGWGARTLAGAEEDGTLELELTSPVSRTQVYLERLAALWLGVLLLAAVVFATTVGLIAVLDMELATVNVLAGSVGLLLLGLALGTLAVAVGAATGRRGIALGTAAGVAVLAFVADAIGPMVDGLGWLTAVSPWSWYLGEDPLVEGFDGVGLSLLAALAVVAALAGLVRYRHRDLGV
ncbi:ABC transporter permease subunit [Egicoccus halophilus]|uniref:ABC transporter permease n=1 Tax=Egicoccus halophilus TaxID=1670830 RepID=A0A8J3AFS4_9ACTN|nr:ABC transporter permease subunit [Egicoccus halophilus]GGI07674.1 ABC transporter permease [Egicoccus halophilus]